MFTQNDNLLIVLQHRYAGKSWCYNGDGYEGLHWTDEAPKPTEDELLSQLDDVNDEIVERNKARADASLSAKTKLRKLGLTDDEIAALVG